MPAFYPNPVFGWMFYGVLIAFLLVATYLDLGRLKIPNKLTIAMLAVGVAFSLARGVWMGILGTNAWFFADGPFLGGVYGLLFSLSGIAVGLGAFCGLWLLGGVGGGDVKLMAALGAWVGPEVIVYLMVGSMVVFLMLGTVRVLQKIFRRGVQKSVFSVQGQAKATNLKKTKAGIRRRDQVLAMSLAVAIAAAILLLLLPLGAAADLHLIPRRPPTNSVPAPQ